MVRATLAVALFQEIKRTFILKIIDIKSSWNGI
jgi:hypothetical protein